MARISMNNRASVVAVEALSAGQVQTALDYIGIDGDGELREELHMEFAPCSERDFVFAWCERYEDKYGEVYTLP